MTILFLLVSQLLAWTAFCATGPLKNEQVKRSVLLLDDFTFPKVVPHSNQDVVVLFSSKKLFGDYGTDSIRTDYFNFAFKMQTEGQANHVLFAQVIVNGPENNDLVEQVLDEGEELTHPKLYVFPAGSATAIPYPNDLPYHLNTLTQFVSEHTTLSFQLPGTLKVFDDLATNFLNADDGRRRGIVSEAERVLEGLDGAPAATGSYYVKLMKKILEHGDGHIKAEIKRQTRLVNDASKVTKAGRRSIENHLNVLNHFAATLPASTSVRDEM